MGPVYLLHILAELPVCMGKEVEGEGLQFMFSSEARHALSLSLFFSYFSAEEIRNNALVILAPDSNGNMQEHSSIVNEPCSNPKSVIYFWKLAIMISGVTQPLIPYIVSNRDERNVIGAGSKFTRE